MLPELHLGTRYGSGEALIGTGRREAIDSNQRYGHSLNKVRREPVERFLEGSASLIQRGYESRQIALFEGSELTGTAVSQSTL